MWARCTIWWTRFSITFNDSPKAQLLSSRTVSSEAGALPRVTIFPENCHYGTSRFTSWSCELPYSFYLIIFFSFWNTRLIPGLPAPAQLSCGHRHSDSWCWDALLLSLSPHCSAGHGVLGDDRIAQPVSENRAAHEQSPDDARAPRPLLATGSATACHILAANARLVRSCLFPFTFDPSTPWGRGWGAGPAVPTHVVQGSTVFSFLSLKKCWLQHTHLISEAGQGSRSTHRSRSGPWGPLRR